MEITKTKSGIKISGVRDLSLPETLCCGQAFRFVPYENGFSGGAWDKKAFIRLDNDCLYIDGGTLADKDFWCDYFDLSLDYAALRKEFAAIHPILSEAVRYAPGIRVLRQNPWEALCSFIISQNNNIARIQGIIERLCLNFGDEKDGFYSFPTAQKLSLLNEEDLAVIRSGFRSRYIIDAARKVAGGEIDLCAVSLMPTDEARAELMKICGVGPKVADCTMLFGMHKLECFPMDVWMKRAMAGPFKGMKPQDFGAYAGIAQQYIFHYSRKNPEIFK